MHELLARSEGPIVGFRVSGTLEKEDYDDMTALLQERIDRHGHVRIFFEMEDFDGWRPRALWEDVKFDIEQNRKITRAAMVGEAAWEKALAKLAKPFAHADVRYFEEAEREEAWHWLRREEA